MNLAEQIACSRAEIRRLVSDGRNDEAALEEAHLRGLLAAWAYHGGGDVACLHRVSKTAGVSDDGKTMWRCVDCGARTRP